MFSASSCPLQHDDLIGDVPHGGQLIQHLVNGYERRHTLRQAVLLHQPEIRPDFRLVEEHSLTEGMAAFVPIYKVLDKLPAVRNISNKIIVLERA